MTLELTEKENEKLKLVVKIYKQKAEFNQDYGTALVLKNILERLEDDTKKKH